MTVKQPGSRVEEIVEHVRGLGDEECRDYLDRLQRENRDLYDQVVIALESATVVPRSDQTSDNITLRAVLTATAGPHAGGTFICAGLETFTFGRSRRARFSVPSDSAMSGLHFMLTLQPGYCLLTDLASSNGTFVNGQRIDMCEAKDGDEIKVGNSTFRVLLEGAAPLRPPAPEDVPTKRFRCLPGYEIEEELGRGGMGVVYRGRRMADAEIVAIKMIRPDRVPAEEDVRRFRREVELLKKLQHPHIIRFLDVGEADGRLFLVMEYVSGGNLKDALETAGPLPLSRAVGLMCQVLEGLAYAHERGVVHRDIKPGNVLVTEGEGREVAKLADFGLARAYQASGLARLTRTGQQMGTPAYMPREQLLDFRAVRPEGDQYSAAATLYHLVTNQLLYDDVRSPTDLLLRLMEERPAVRLEQRCPDLPVAWAEVVHRALQHQPDRRFITIAEFRQALLPFASDR